ncbi:yzbB [Nonlabens marinus S1-08]|uniref:YzbB n=2 Tax=Nonlabens TaxID=363408 RepID=W8VVI2_9FLAO|nr:yzbB [Nonlabens marinus S1-08]
MALVMTSCNGSIGQKSKTTTKNGVELPSAVDLDSTRNILPLDNEPVTAADQIGSWVGQLKGKRVAVVGNQTSVVNTLTKAERRTWDQAEKIKYVHLVDTLISLGVDVKKVFAPEHGFRGEADAGAVVEDGIDKRSGLPIISLYGSNKKPTKAQLADVDIILFDIQDVGARFYTYISTLHYVMEAAADSNKTVYILDRPNPNGHYIDGPILDSQHKSFVGMHPVPVVHGMTIGEYAQMINGEKWLPYGKQASIKVFKNQHYTHATPYHLPIPPSPNLPNAQSINLYPSLCFFEGTDVSVGRGTDMQFQVYGSPSLAKYRNFSFTPTPNAGAKRPPFNGKKCFGVDLREYPRLNKLQLEFVVDAFAKAPYKESFFNSFFTNLAGTEKLQAQIEKAMSAEAIAATWESDLKAYDQMRQAYLLYE